MSKRNGEMNRVILAAAVDKTFSVCMCVCVCVCGAAQEVSIARRREARSKSKNVHPLTIFFDFFFVCCVFPFVVFFAFFFHSLSIYSGPPSLHPTPTVYTYIL